MLLSLNNYFNMKDLTKEVINNYLSILQPEITKSKGNSILIHKMVSDAIDFGIELKEDETKKLYSFEEVINLVSSYNTYSHDDWKVILSFEEWLKTFKK